MTAFAPGQTIRSRSPLMPVDALVPGVHLFRLVVVDDDRIESEPAELRVRVLARGEQPPPDRVPIDRIPIDRIPIDRIPIPTPAPPTPVPRPRPPIDVIRQPVRPVDPEPDPPVRPIRPLRPGRPG